jgi:integrase/recombinase XerD
LAFAEFTERKARRSLSTAQTYQAAVNAWASSLQMANPDEAVAAIKAGNFDVYKGLDTFVAHLMNAGFAPRTIWNYLSAVRGFLRFDDVPVDQYKVRDKITLPPKVEVSIDRIPTRDEIKKLLLEGDLRLKAAIAILASSGMRVGELCKLRIGNMNFEKHPVQITILGKYSKSKASRIVRITDETANLVKEYLGNRIRNAEDYLFPSPTNQSEPVKRNAMAMSIRRLIERCGLLKKIDPDSRRYEVHVHCFRKYFFTQVIASGIDRGIAEYFMGHKYGLDSNYLRLNEEALDQEYAKAADKLVFLREISPSTVQREEMSTLTHENEELRERLARLEDQFETILKTKITNET